MNNYQKQKNEGMNYCYTVLPGPWMKTVKEGPIRNYFGKDLMEAYSKARADIDGLNLYDGVMFYITDDGLLEDMTVIGEYNLWDEYGINPEEYEKFVEEYK